MKIDTTKEQIEKELLEGIKETGITSISRELLDDNRICYLVLTSQLLGLRQGFDMGRPKIFEEIEKRFNELANNLPEESNHNFNRNSILGKIKNEVLIIKKLVGETK